ncbi:MAG: sugar-binding transcriptional regulator [Firmicutes bacterium]|nr:sugar-binding transcriptional regulator [Bacillota bacterium]
MGIDKENKKRVEYIRIASYYYKWGLTQNEISKKINVSRQKVNRMLKECVKLGIVKFVIPELEDSYVKLESEIEKKYNLKAVRIAKHGCQENLYSALGRTGSEYLMKIFSDGDTIGFSRGRSVSNLVDSINPRKIKDTTAVQLMGGWNNENTNGNSDEIVHRFSEKVNARPAKLYAPVVVESKILKEAILKEASFLKVYDIIKSCSISVVGIGNAKYPELIPTMGEKDYSYIKDKAVGEICTHFFDENGDYIKTPFNDRVISVEYEDYMNIPIRIGVAGSLEKLKAIKGAVAGKIINVLITDFETAKHLL